MHRAHTCTVPSRAPPHRLAASCAGDRPLSVRLSSLAAACDLDGPAPEACSIRAISGAEVPWLLSAKHLACVQDALHHVLM